jgi:hypothetical protein
LNEPDTNGKDAQAFVWIALTIALFPNIFAGAWLLSALFLNISTPTVRPESGWLISAIASFLIYLTFRPRYSQECNKAAQTTFLHLSAFYFLIWVIVLGISTTET